MNMPIYIPVEMQSRWDELDDKLKTIYTDLSMVIDQSGRWTGSIKGLVSEYSINGVIKARLEEKVEHLAAGEYVAITDFMNINEVASDASFMYWCKAYLNDLADTVKFEVDNWNVIDPELPGPNLDPGDDDFDIGFEI